MAKESLFQTGGFQQCCDLEFIHPEPGWSWLDALKRKFEAAFESCYVNTFLQEHWLSAHDRSVYLPTLNQGKYAVRPWKDKLEMIIHKVLKSSFAVVWGCLVCLKIFPEMLIVLQFETSNWDFNTSDWPLRNKNRMTLFLCVFYFSWVPWMKISCGEVIDIFLPKKWLC